MDRDTVSWAATMNCWGLGEATRDMLRVTTLASGFFLLGLELALDLHGLDLLRAWVFEATF